MSSSTAATSLTGRLPCLLLSIVLVAGLGLLPLASAIPSVTFSFEENTGADFSVGRLTNQQSSSNDYQFTGESAQICSQYFNLVASTSEILTKVNIDREAVVIETESDILSCQVSYTGGTAQVHFHILDQNDVVPTIAGISQPIEVYENVPKGQIITYLMPVDPDAGLNGTVNFTILSGNEENFFNLTVSSGQSTLSDRLLVLRERLNYETHKSFNLTLFVTDSGTPRLNRTQQLIINIIDINDQAPTFDVDFHFNVSENHTLGSSHPIGIIDASDPDSPTHSQIFYQLDIENSRDHDAADYFAVNTTSGELYLIDRLDFDDSTIKHLFEFRVEARNPGRPSGTKADITVTILDANDEVPYLVPTSSTLQGISENASSSNFIFVFKDEDDAKGDNEIGEVQVTFDPHVNYTVRVDKIILPTISTIFVVIQVNQSINREWTKSLFLSVTVSDKGSPRLSSTINQTIPIFDANDNSPQFTKSSYKVRISSSSRPTMELTYVSAVDPDNGENGTVIYSIGQVSPSIATNWFSIDATSGLVSLISLPNYEAVNGHIQLTIIAEDNGTEPLSNTTTLTISLSPSVTFQPISFQQYNGDINMHLSTLVYMEFKTDSTNTLLLYQNSSSSSSSSLDIINGYPVFNKAISSPVYVSNNKWYSLLFNRTKGSLDVWERTNISTNNKVLKLLQTATIRECNSQQQPQNTLPLYIGGVPNIFTTPHLTTSNFMGTIAAVIINGRHLDLSCPSSSRNTFNGSHVTNVCESPSSSSLPCSGSSQSYCTPYTPSNVSPCHCINGLPIETCNEEQDYGPISITNNSFMQFELGYDFFYSISTMNDTSDQQHEQTISFSFIPKTSSLTGLLFYSKTSDTIFQRLEVDQTFRYTVSSGNMPKLSLVSDPVKFEGGKEYTVVLKLTTNTDTISMRLIESGGQNQLLKLSKDTRGAGTIIDYYPFIMAPHTVVSLGGTNNTGAIAVPGHFTGCITGFSIDDMVLPLQGILVSKALNLNTSLGTYPFCHPCNMATSCPTNSTCHTTLPLSDSKYYCTCNEGHTNISGVCLLPPSLPPTPTRTIHFTTSTPITSREPVTDGLETKGSFKFYYIVAIAGTAVFIIALIIVLLAVMFRFAYTRGKKDTRRPQLVTQITYHQGNGDCCHDDKDLVDGSVTDGIVPAPKRSNDYVKTHLIKTMRTSFDENDSALGSINSPCSYRKSTSQETGFHTASEGGPSARSSPHRRSASKDSERYDSDFTSFETDSEDLTTSGIEEVMSPNEVTLVSSGSMMGVPASFRLQNPLSPHEKKAMTPLQPNSSMLLSEDETDTEVSTTTNTNRRRYYDNDSLVSDQNGTKWYKNSSPSTVVESENESPYGSKAAALHKKTRHKHRPPSLPHIKTYKGASPSPHGSPYGLGGYPLSNGHLSNSPLIKSHRPQMGFEYPPPPSLPTPAMSHIIPSSPMMYSNGYLDHHHHGSIEQSRLPAIAESSFQYPHHHKSPYPPPPSHHHTLYHHDPSAHSSYDPTHPPYEPAHAPYEPTHPPYYPGYQGTSLTPGGGGPPTTYCDLNSFSKVNPITYWEQQQRLRPTVDQDDPLRFLTEPCRKFEDVSTTPSVAESTVVDSVVDKDSAVSVPTRRPITSRGVYTDHVVLPRTLPPHPLAPALESEGEEEEEEEEEEVEGITHFPSADCTPTLLSPNSDNNPQHSISTLGDSQNSYHFPDYA